MLRNSARDVARRSFNGKEVVLVCTNDKALPIAINLAANLARLDLHHALLLGADACVDPRGSILAMRAG